MHIISIKVMPHLTDKEIQRRELLALFVAHGSKYGWTHLKMQGS